MGSTKASHRYSAFLNSPDRVTMLIWLPDRVLLCP